MAVEEKENKGNAQEAGANGTGKSETAGQNGQEDVCMAEQDIAKVLDAIAETNRRLEEMTDRYKRLQADFDNFRRRTRQEKEELSVVVSQNIILQLLPVLDNFERALATGSAQEEGLRTGVEMIYRQLYQAFEKLGLETIIAAGNEFDPQLHEAVLSVADESLQDGQIAEELQRGYKLFGKVLRPSMVKVVKNG